MKLPSCFNPQMEWQQCFMHYNRKVAYQMALYSSFPEVPKNVRFQKEGLIDIKRV
ncbi:MAG: hypothetical protein V7739_18500 [Motiliproteus sp.]